jgi:preprotein translocase subunit SecE
VPWIARGFRFVSRNASLDLRGQRGESRAEPSVAAVGKIDPDRKTSEFAPVQASETGAMGKVKDEVSASKPLKPGKGKSGSAPRGLFVQFLVNLTRVDLFKPMQGWYARVYTALGLGLIVAAGAWRVEEAASDYSVLWKFGAPTAFALLLGWVVFRIIHFPPFAEFLIATEAEMNKVSWTSKDDLIRATTVVLTTVVLMAVFLFLVDTLWTFILRFIHVLQFSGSGGFGSTA